MHILASVWLLLHISSLSLPQNRTMRICHVVLMNLTQLSVWFDVLKTHRVELVSMVLGLRQVSVENGLFVAKLVFRWSQLTVFIVTWQSILLCLSFASTKSHDSPTLTRQILIILLFGSIRCIFRRHRYRVVILYVEYVVACHCKGICIFHSGKSIRTHFAIELVMLSFRMDFDALLR